MNEPQSITAQIIDLAHDGRGVTDIDGRRYFVAGALIGEEVRVELKKGRRRKKLDLEPLEILDRSELRADPHCQYFGRCGGCAVQHLTYPAQIEFKQRVVEQAFHRIGEVEPDQWLPPGTSNQWAYRRRARLGARYVEGKGRALVGFRERSASYITDMQSCPVLVAPIGAAIGELADVLSRSSVAKCVPQFEVSVGDDAGAMIIRALQPLTEQDEAAFLEFGAKHQLDIYVQPGGPGSVRPLSDSRPLYYDLVEFDIRIGFSPTDFIQVNARINEQIISEAIKQADVQRDETVLDLFCGIGNFSLPFARRAAQVTGVEGDAGLVARAASNAQANSINNAEFVTADLSKGGWSILRQHWDVVVLDPPRSGAAALQEDWSALSPRRIIYVSCHPASLARDARVLVEQHGYKMTSAKIFDMFPNTHHVETMAVFDRA